MKSIITTIACLILSVMSYGQEKFLTKSGHVSFFSHSPIEDIEAENDQVLSIIDTNNGAIAISILMKSFLFEKALMQEHFNENYVESDKYPKATFKGELINFSTLENNAEVTIKGNLTIHGVTKPTVIKAKIKKTEGNISLEGNFPVKVEDFNIEIPSVVVNNIAKTIKVTFNLDHQPYTK
ncbi:YceI family protein [Aquimarina spongiae]|uniref:YceI-like domain-containing protein n=1 Tax=Aquimarina spongiae TaxID=570521 RepID=A0A1M6AZA3_9FLAO|nr:YceI family protein [Aquimarina spongiae]SHI41553.1 YceI-like domain-containing protein [Aquimarina spongiae]